MKFSSPIIYTICLLQGMSAFAVTPNKPAAAKPVEAAKPAAPALILRISKIDGVENPNHKKEIKRQPGKKISFSADLFVKENGKLVAQKANSQDFLWTISTNNRVCDPARASSTCKPTGIDVTQEGISFKVLAGTYGIVDDTTEDMSVKVVYAKDRKLTDSITIINKTYLDELAALEKDAAELAEIRERNSGLGSFLGNLFGALGSSSSGEDSYYQPDAEADHRQKMEQYRELEKSSPSVARDLRAIEQNSYSALHANDHQRGGWNRGNNGGNGRERGNWNRPAPSAPAPYVAPTPAPVVVAPAPTPTPGGHFGGRDRDGDGQPDRRGVGFGRPGRGGESAPAAPVPAAPAVAAPTPAPAVVAPAPAAPAAPALPSGRGWKPVRQM